VQGVGFRPFVYRLAKELDLAGWIRNSPQGVLIEAQGPADALEAFRRRLHEDLPAGAAIEHCDAQPLAPAEWAPFEIRPSRSDGDRTAIVLPDLATCPECRAEVFDPSNRRYRYPFTNCTHCGPRYSIIRSLPYDRPNTSMSGFAMCADCRREYESPEDRRFHAQPNACPACGPRIELWNDRGRPLADGHAALPGAAQAIRDGLIVAVKGLGGFHLFVDAANDAAVERLRLRKHREEKPFALMMPSLEAVREACRVCPEEEAALCSPAAPIVLLRRATAGISAAVAPGIADWGVMLPYTPLHHLLMAEIGRPVVATSGNLSDEPICTDPVEALHRLGEIADLFLVHDRPIVRHVDDSVVRVVLGQPMVLRCARGYAPLALPADGPAGILAVGGHLKNAVAVSTATHVLLSQHIGDLETRQAVDAFEATLAALSDLHEIRPALTACDPHPDYRSTAHARRLPLDRVEVQHHHAHVAACMADNDLHGEVLAACWDGTGHGTDGTVWGGEWLLASRRDFRRVAHLRHFSLPGGEAAVREPRRSAIGLLHEVFGPDFLRHAALPPLASFPPAQLRCLERMIHARINTPRTSSAGRLLDGLASLLGLRQSTTHEGQAAMALEAAIDGRQVDESYPVLVRRAAGHGGTNAGAPAIVDWEPLLIGVLEDLARDLPRALVAAKIHNTLVEMVLSVARHIGEERVVLTGGCFQNRYLLERAVSGLRAGGFRPFWHHRVPPNDGGLAVGQAVVAASRRRED
jgi:hydrogenase maturation protein HypF